MTNPEINNGMDNNFPGGPPMVRIDGASVRRIREQKGLTQLYVATVVQVTTDTISRWENRRYPSIKKENAEKLAEALEVELAALLEQEEPQTPPEAAATPAPPLTEAETAASPAPLQARRDHRLLTWLTGFLLLGLALALLLRFLPGGRPEHLPVIAASRILPPHVPPGQEFPVLLRVTAQPSASFSLIIRENFPPGCRFTLASPAVTGAPGQDGQLKWVSRLEGRERRFAYLLTSPTGAVLGSPLAFRGQVVAGSRGETTVTATGAERLTITPHHWADGNGDNIIDDEEILAVYDQFGDVAEFAALRDELDRLWTGGGYRWDENSHRYLVAKQNNIK